MLARFKVRVQVQGAGSGSGRRVQGPGSGFNGRSRFACVASFIASIVRRRRRTLNLNLAPCTLTRTLHPAPCTLNRPCRSTPSSRRHLVSGKPRRAGARRRWLSRFGGGRAGRVDCRGDRATCRPDVLGAGRGVGVQGRRGTGVRRGGARRAVALRQRSRASRSIRTAHSPRRSADAVIDDRGAACDLRHRRSSARCRRPTQREHSLEMQLPFLRRVLPDVPIVPLLIGHQTRETIIALGTRSLRPFAGGSALLVASTDLSHYFDAATAAELDARVLASVSAFDPEDCWRSSSTIPSTTAAATWPAAAARPSRSCWPRAAWARPTRAS